MLPVPVIVLAPVNVPPLASNQADPVTIYVLVSTLNVPSPPDVLTKPFEVREPNFLFVNDSAPASVASVPVVGNVTPVEAVTVNVVAKFPEMVIVDAALLATPVPPFAAPK